MHYEGRATLAIKAWLVTSAAVGLAAAVVLTVVASILYQGRR